MSVSTAFFKRPPFLTRLFNRLIGDWPLFGGPIPLSQDTFKDLFASYPSFADFLPLAGYDPESGFFELDDGVSMGAVFRLGAADLEGRSPEKLEEFREQVDHALQLLPTDDELYPVIAQFYLESREPVNIADRLAAATSPEIRDSAFSQAWFAAQREHFEMMCAPRGIFDDERVRLSGEQAKGWRAIEQQIHVCLFRKAPASAWKHRHYSPAQRFQQMITPFLSSLEAAGVRVARVDEDGLRQWLLPWLTPEVAGFASPRAYLHAAGPLPPVAQRGAAWDLAQHLVQLPPQPIPNRNEERDRGVWRFGPVYTRYLTLQGIEFAPDDGALTLDRQTGAEVRACPWDRLPPQSILTWTCIPRSQEVIDSHLDTFQMFVDQTTSDSAHAADEELQEAKSSRRQHQMIYSVQMGVYLRAPSLLTLDERTLQAGNVLAMAKLRPIAPHYDLIADDSFVRNLPFAYDWRHERGWALRTRWTYTAHLAAILPFCGRSIGTAHPCFTLFRRDGQTFSCNPYHPDDRARVAHMVVFGPTGSGKSATSVGMAMSSMAVNRPRQIIIEKGNSFGLMVQYYARHGLQVEEILFSRNRDVCYPPYVDTAKALAEHRGELRFTEEGESDEQRSYLAEMLFMTELMITGGRQREIEALTTASRTVIQQALIRALEHSEQAGHPHARPEDVAQVLHVMAKEESIPEIRLVIRNMASAMELWVEGLRGHFFNRHGQGFADANDVIHIDLGILTANGNEDMLALAVLSLLANITAWSEKHQASGRHTEVWFDEAHYISKTPLTVKGFIVGTKVWRKLHTWLVFATQDFSDTSELAKQILSQAEFWMLLSMGANEARQVAQFRDMTPDEQKLLTMALKEPGRFVEGILLSEKYPPALLRLVPPALALALAQTEGDEKAKRLQLMQQHGIGELDAALRVAEQIADKRRRHRETEEA